MSKKQRDVLALLADKRSTRAPQVLRLLLQPALGRAG